MVTNATGKPQNCYIFLEMQSDIHFQRFFIFCLFFMVMFRYSQQIMIIFNREKV